jgi:hypothetical protein
MNENFSSGSKTQFKKKQELSLAESAARYKAFTT